jgi:23S rRNA (cytidine1920-2'-O)/16S rRNA (cytidine1409-2'-O)-methyltransferase
LKTKIRLDHLIVQRGLAESGAKAQALILAGHIKAPGLQATLKPGLLVSEEQPLELLSSPKYVSRGGEKLEGALYAFRVDPSGRLCLDVGSSTGGFTDCLLQRGAEKVFALDVGTAQLHWKLRKDPRVLSREKTHILRLTRADLPFTPSLVVVDVSFISLEKVLPHVASLLEKGAELVVLVKPQFEAGPKNAPKGVVRDPAVREEVLRRLSSLLPAWGFIKKGECPSPLTGPEGNVEYFFHLLR